VLVLREFGRPLLRRFLLRSFACRVSISLTEEDFWCFFPRGPAASCRSVLIGPHAEDNGFALVFLEEEFSCVQSLSSCGPGPHPPEGSPFPVTTEVGFLAAKEVILFTPPRSPASPSLFFDDNRNAGLLTSLYWASFTRRRSRFYFSLG